MENITYFIGAGASYHSLPLIKTMNERMKAFSSYLKAEKNNGRITNEFAEQFITDLDELIEIEPKRTSIDAYARELSISNMPDSKQKLLRLKAILSSYIVFEQTKKPEDFNINSDLDLYEVIDSPKKPLDNEIQEMIKTPIDKRYYTFWGNYLDDRNDFLPNNINIISWNYDIQFEFSYSEIKDYSLELSQQNLNVFPSDGEKINPSNSCILKLNGTAGLFNSLTHKGSFNLYDLRNFDLKKIQDLLFIPLQANYKKATETPLFSFAWETDETSATTRQYAKQIIENTSILVIIGYSFPDFNRTIDRFLFEKSPNLKKIYYQAPENEIKELIGKLDGVNISLRPMVIPINNLATFHIPNEYYEQ